MSRLQYYIKISYKGVFALMCLLLISTACYREPKFPDAALSKEQMIGVLSDVHLAEAKLASMGNFSQVQRDSAAEVYYATIFKIHKVKAEDFNNSMNAYMQNPKALSEIYEKVLEKLQKEQSDNLKKK
jgi:hypothetical protein